MRRTGCSSTGSMDDGWIGFFDRSCSGSKGGDGSSKSFCWLLCKVIGCSRSIVVCEEEY